MNKRRIQTYFKPRSPMFTFLKNLFQKKIPIVIVAGMGRRDRAIGKENGLLWHVPADMKRFKALTVGHPIIMGRKTFESIIDILGKPLPGRTNIIITRDHTYSYEGTKVAHSIEEALEIARSENPKEIHIGGGAEIYRLVLPQVDRLHITWFDSNKTGDVFFPPFEDHFTIIKTHEPQEHKGVRFQWVDYGRNRS